MSKGYSRTEAVIYVEREGDEYELNVLGEVRLGKHSDDPQECDDDDVCIKSIGAGETDWMPLLTSDELEMAEEALIEAAKDDAEGRAADAAELKWEAREDR